jgi:cob(I)alamin adenosyltransferase
MPRPPRKSKLYTRTGDRGQTGLFGGRRVAKDDPRVEAYGSIDELNAALGVVAAKLQQRNLILVVQSIQNELFNIGAELASDRPVRRGRRSTSSFELDASKVVELESLIDQYDALVPELRTFILPGGSEASALLHLARTIGRRAERATVTLAAKEPVSDVVLAYLNRLCDLLFVLARYVSKADRKRELLWRKDV